MADTGDFTLWIIALVTLTLVDAQRFSTSTPPPSTTTGKPASHRGLVLTVKKNFYSTKTGAQIRSIPAIPYYDSWDSMVPGIKFSNDDIHFLSVDVDYKQKVVYLYDYHLKSIAIGLEYNPDLNLDNMTFDFMHAGVSKGTVQVAYDWYSRTLYWADPGFGWVAAAPGNPDLTIKDYYKIIVRGLDKPDGIAVDPYAGFLFVSDNGYSGKKIERTTLTGAGKRTIVHRGLYSPRALEVDHWSNRLFWIDSYSEEINSITYDGTDRQLLRRIAGANLFDMAIYQEMAIISDISDGNIYFLNKTSGKSMYSTIRIGSETTYGIAVYTEDNQPKGSDPCMDLQCPHLCMTVPEAQNKAKCVCSEGYEYYATNNTCIERAGSYHRAVILMTSTDICYGDIRSLASYSYNATCVFSIKLPTVPRPTTTTTTTRRSTYRPFNYTTARQWMTTRTPTTAQTQEPPEKILYMDVDMEERILYFATEKNIYSRSVDQGTYSGARTGVTATNLIISGLVYDWVDRYNLYYSTTAGYIYLKNIKDTSVERIIQDSATMGNLVLMQDSRRLAWTVTSGSSSKLQSGNLDGSGTIETLKDHRSEIVSLSYDQHTRQFFWIESYYVYQFSPYANSSYPKIIRFNYVQDAFSLQVYKNSLIIAEKHVNYTQFLTLDLTSTATYKTIKSSGKFDNLLDVDGFKILDIELQPDEPSFCKHDNGGCQQLCLTTHDGHGYMQKRCDCSYGYQLQPDGKSCKSSAKTDTDFLLFADYTHDKITQVDLNTEQFHALDLDVSGTPKAVLYNPLTELVMFSQQSSNYVYAAKLNGTASEIYVQLDSYATANRMALDETTGNIYYTSTFYNYIGLITPHGTYIQLRVNDLFYSDVKAIAVHPGKGYMYYSVQDYRNTYIGRAYMDGGNPERIINDTMVWPDGLAIDYQRGYLYWSDRYYDTIKRCDLDGNYCEGFVEDSGADISDLVIDGNYLYYSTYVRGIFKVSLTAASRTKVKVGTETEMGRIISLNLYKKDSNNKQPVSDGCRANDGKGLCSTICLPRPFGRFTCACDNGIPFKDETERTCADVFQCEEFLGNAQAPSSCTRYAESWCELECQSGYMKAPSANMTAFCSRVGWSENEVMCIEVKCDVTLQNVQFMGECTGKVGEVCSYTCSRGYSPVRNPATVQCLDGANWDIATDFCKETTCPVDGAIPNGGFTPGCEGKVNTICNYECNQYYIPSISPARMTCQVLGSWNRDVSTACKAVECPNALSHGDLGTCSRSVGVSCGFSCQSGFVQTVDQVVCTVAGSWSPPNACKRMPCSKTIRNGTFATGCSGEYNSECIFTCNSPYYTPTINSNKLKCDINGQWKNGQTNINTDTLCQEVLCMRDIPNADLESSCDRKVLSVCDFTCKQGYEKSIGVYRATCMDNGQWSTNDVSPACVETCGDGQFRCKNGQCIPKEKECDSTPDCADKSDEGDRCVACPETIPNGELISCDYSVGRSCDYKCKDGYQKEDDTVICLIGGVWHSEAPCKEITCNDIPNADLANSCDKKVSSVCDFTCKSGYQKNTGVNKATCTKTGDWSTNGVIACISTAPGLCPSTISHGALVNCDRTVGTSCNFTCKAGYSKTTNEVVCKSGGVWHVSTPCKMIHCPRTVENGKISSECKSLTIGKSCAVVCNDNYKLSKTEKITCLPSGDWSVSRVCDAIAIKPQGQQQQKPSGPSSGAVVGIVIGIIFLLAVVVVIGILLVFHRRRLFPGRFGSSPSAKYSTSDIAIENPGYMNATLNVMDDTRHDTRQENPYDNADFQPVGYSNGPDLGYTNPMYKTVINTGSEPLPEQSDIAVNQDDVVLTTDSWQKEQLKGPEA